MRSMILTPAHMRMVMASFPCLHNLTLYTTFAGDDSETETVDDTMNGGNSSSNLYQVL